MNPNLNRRNQFTKSLLGSNPYVPGQRLKVQIPEGTKSNDQFKATVQKPKVTQERETENKLSKDCILALADYSQVYDDWCIAEGKYRSLLAEKKKEKDLFKIGVERLKKYDSMIKVFPKNLATPIDPSFLRKVVSSSTPYNI